MSLSGAQDRACELKAAEGMATQGCCACSEQRDEYSRRGGLVGADDIARAQETAAQTLRWARAAVASLLYPLCDPCGRRIKGPDLVPLANPDASNPQRPASTGSDEWQARCRSWSRRRSQPTLNAQVNARQAQGPYVSIQGQTASAMNAVKAARARHTPGGDVPLDGPHLEHADKYLG